jgi:hypothetical protein
MTKTVQPQPGALSLAVAELCLVRPMRCLLALLVIIAASGYAFAAEELKKYEVWITGDVFEQNHHLMFRCDKAVKGNAAGNVVYLGASRQTAKVLLPMYMMAAEQHKKLRLYGLLVPTDEKTKKSEPSVQFITWKAHLPNEPDELRADQKIIIGPNDKVPGYKVEATPKPK